MFKLRKIRQKLTLSLTPLGAVHAAAQGVIDTVGKTTVFEHFRKRNMEKDKKKDERREKSERMTRS